MTDPYLDKYFSWRCSYCGNMVYTETDVTITCRGGMGYALHNDSPYTMTLIETPKFEDRRNLSERVSQVEELAHNLRNDLSQRPTKRDLEEQAQAYVSHAQLEERLTGKIGNRKIGNLKDSKEAQEPPNFNVYQRHEAAMEAIWAMSYHDKEVEWFKTWWPAYYEAYGHTTAAHSHLFIFLEQVRKVIGRST